MVKRNWFFVVFFISIIALGSALIAEFLFNLEPCKLCLKQREPYYIFILIFLIFLIFKFQIKIWFYASIQIVSLYGLFYSIWHVGIENKILSGPSGCSTGLSLSKNTIALKEQILSKAVINCEDVIWSIFGLSAATINSLLLFLIFIINAIYLMDNFNIKKYLKKNDQEIKS